MSLIIVILYGCALTFILLYSIVQFILVLNYIKFRKKDSINTQPLKEFPFVTIQLPIYNELYVIERLIDCISDFDYPKDKFEIQILDDSTDETTSIITKKVAQMKSRNVQIHHIRRENRIGFKAGALQEGLQTAKGEYIAIFDADFLPNSDFLIKTLPYFRNEKIGVVQTRWGHINKNYSLLTKLQAFGLDGHFTLEQVGRNSGGHFINFNGTGGVWRKKCIEDAGGWEYDTLTEDLDLSYRAQLKGWKFKYLENVRSPAELPVTMDAIKNQQFRWTKGGAENFRKMIFRVIKTNKISLKTKIHACFHLLNSSVFLCVFLVTFFSFPILFIKNNFPIYDNFFRFSTIFILSLIFLTFFYWHSYDDKSNNFLKDRLSFVMYFFLFLAFSIGLSFHNSIAILEGYVGKKSSFIRTPKFNIVTSKDKWKGNKYLTNKISLITILESVLALYFLAGIFGAFYLKDYSLLPFQILLLYGYSSISYHSWTQTKLS